jgi:glycogen(starch) synthase
MMRLLFLTNFYPPHGIGGYEQWCQEVADALADRGHEVTVLTSRYGVDSPPGGQPAPAENGATQPVVHRSLQLQTDLAYYRPLRFLTRWQTEEAENRRLLLAALDNVRPDLVVVWGMWNFSLNLPYWAEQRLPGRVAYYLCSYWPTDLDPHRAYWSKPANTLVGKLLKVPLQRWAHQRLDSAGYPPQLRFAHAACCSHYVRDTLVRQGAVPPAAGVLFGGTDPAPFLAAAAARTPAANGELRLLYFGRLVEDKGVHTIIEALNLLKDEIDLTRVRLTILGSGHPAYEAYLRKLVSAYGLSAVVEFVGAVQRSEVPHWLGQHDVFLFTSIWAEPMARSVMEAMAARLFVIGSEVGGQTEMLHNNANSFTFTAGDAAGLARQLARTLEQPQLRLRLAAAGQELVLRDFTLNGMVGAMESWFETIAAGPKVVPAAAATAPDRRLQ